MRILRIQIKGINTFKAEQSIEFPDGVIGIVGRNGAGKTTLVEAIMGTLYGRMPFRKGVILNRVSKSCEKGEMELEFEYKKSVYKAVRKVTRISQKAFLYLKEGEKWQPLVSKGAVKLFDKKILELLCSYETMLSSVFCSQNNAHDLLTVDPTDRKEIFRDLLGIGDLERKSDAYGKLKTELCSKIDEARSGYERMKAEVQRKDDATKQLENANKSAKSVEGEIRRKNALAQELQKEKGEIVSQLNRTDEIRVEYESVAKHINSLESETIILVEKLGKIENNLKNRTKIEEKAKKYLNLEKQYSTIIGCEKEKNRLEIELTNKKAALREKKSGLEYEMSDLSSQKEDAEKRMGALKKIDCEREDCPFIKDALLAKKELPKIKIAEDTLQKKIKAFKDTSPETDDIEKKISSIKAEDASEIESQMEECREAYQLQGSFKDTEERKKEYSERVENAKKAIQGETVKKDKLRGQLEQIKKTMKDRDIDEEIENVNIKISAFVEEKEECQRQIGYLEGQLESIKRIEKDLAVTDAKFKDNMEDMEDYAILEKAYGKDGIQALLIDKAIPEFNDYANEMLQICTDGQWHVEFRTQKPLKTSDILREELNTILISDEGELEIGECSEGEQQLLRTVIRITLGIYNVISSGKQIKFFVLDEPFHGLDPENKPKMVKMIGYIKKYFNQILITSNQPDIVSSLPTLIQVEKYVDGSKIKRVR